MNLCLPANKLGLGGIAILAGRAKVSLLVGPRRPHTIRTTGNGCLSCPPRRLVVHAKIVRHNPRDKVASEEAGEWRTPRNSSCAKVAKFVLPQCGQSLGRHHSPGA